MWRSCCIASESFPTLTAASFCGVGLQGVCANIVWHIKIVMISENSLVIFIVSDFVDGFGDSWTFTYYNITYTKV